MRNKETAITGKWAKLRKEIEKMESAATTTIAKLSPAQVEQLDPYRFLAVLGKRVIHPGGRRSTKELFQRADFATGQSVIDVGCGVGTSAIEIARRYGAHVTAADISPLMLAHARANVQKAGVEGKVEVVRADLQHLPYSDNSFDRVLAEAVTMYVDRSKAARELTRVCKPGGRVLITEYVWRKPPTTEARQAICPNIKFDTLEDWVRIYQEAGLQDLQVTSGPFETISPRGFLADEGIGNTLAIVGRTLSRVTYANKMAELLPRTNRAVPYLGYVAISAVKPF
jgi:SAM-dependent methyltransferase